MDPYPHKSIEKPHSRDGSFHGDHEGFGAHSAWDVVVADRSDPRPWLQRAPICPPLARYHMLHSGWMETPSKMQITRQHPDGSFVMLTLSGTGEVLIDGSWHEIEPKHAVLLPPFTPNMFRSRHGAWSFCWVRFQERDGYAPIITTNTPICRAVKNHGLYHAICGLIDASRPHQDPASQSIWIDALMQQINQIKRPAERDPRLEQLWSSVEQSLSRPWSLQELADHAHVSPEHLRRLCRRDLGRSPMQHLIYLRMRAAQSLLRNTTETIETICKAVGYHQPFTFSNTFQKWMGARPSAIRPKTRTHDG